MLSRSYLVGLIASGLLPAAVSAQGDYIVTIWQNEGCTGDKIELHTFEPSGDSCQWGTVIPSDDWEFNDQGQWRGYVDGSGLDSRCKVGFITQSTAEPDKCGIPFAIIDGALEHQCRGVWFDEGLGTKYCCSEEQCEGVGMNTAAAQSLPAQASGQQRAKAPGSLASASAPAPVLRGRGARPPIGQTSNKSKREDCKWTGSEVIQRRGDPVKITGDLTCTQADGCQLTNTATVGFSATQTFGISSEVGASFFELVQASVSFSYEYSYEENQSGQVSYAVTQPSGTTGYLSFTQEYECTTGTWSGDCDWEASGEGDACIPKKLEGGQPDGQVVFVQNL